MTSSTASNTSGSQNTIVLEAEDVKRFYTIRRGILKDEAVVRALDGVSFQLFQGKTLAVVGESGCGKSTLARVATMIEPPSDGKLVVDGIRLPTKDTASLKRLRQAVQIVFQDPYGSLNPRKKVSQILEEPLIINTDLSPGDRKKRVQEMLTKVGMRPEQADRYPHMFSGGQRQRVAIARALMLEPKIIVADEPVSALDVSIQAQVLNLMMDLQDEFGFSYLFISHDLSVVRHISDELMVMYLGKPMEQGEKTAIFDKPLHPYTKFLLAATPSVNPEERKEHIFLKGELPSPLNPPSGCVFRTRCPYAGARCASEIPPLRPVRDRLVACHYAEDILEGRREQTVSPDEAVGTMVDGAEAQNSASQPQSVTAE